MNVKGVCDHLDVPRVCLIREPIFQNSQDSVEDPDFLVGIFRLTKAGTHLDLKGFLHLAFVPQKVFPAAQAGEVVAVDDKGKGSLGMMEAAGR